MYVIASIVLDGDEYEVGADVSYESSGPFRGYEVDEPDVSAANCRLKHSRIVDTDTLPEGWSDTAKDALVCEYGAALESAEDARGDYYYDLQREEDC